MENKEQDTILQAMLIDPRGVMTLADLSGLAKWGRARTTRVVCRYVKEGKFQWVDVGGSVRACPKYWDGELKRVEGALAAEIEKLVTMEVIEERKPFLKIASPSEIKGSTTRTIWEYYNAAHIPIHNSRATYELWVAHGFSKGSVTGHITRLVQQGWLEKIEPGTYKAIRPTTVPVEQIEIVQDNPVQSEPVEEIAKMTTNAPSSAHIPTLAPKSRVMQEVEVLREKPDGSLVAIDGTGELWIMQKIAV